MQKQLKLAKSGPGPFEALCQGALNAKRVKIGQIWARAIRLSLNEPSMQKLQKKRPNLGPGPSRLSLKERLMQK